MTKPFYRPKTVIFNTVAVIVFLASVFGYADFAPDPELMALVASLVNLALRYKTDTGIVLCEASE